MGTRTRTGLEQNRPSGPAGPLWKRHNQDALVLHLQGATPSGKCKLGAYRIHCCFCTFGLGGGFTPEGPACTGAALAPPWGPRGTPGGAGSQSRSQWQEAGNKQRCTPGVPSKHLGVPSDGEPLPPPWSKAKLMSASRTRAPGCEPPERRVVSLPAAPCFAQPVPPSEPSSSLGAESPRPGARACARTCLGLTLGPPPRDAARGDWARRASGAWPGG